MPSLSALFKTTCALAAGLLGLVLAAPRAAAATSDSNAVWLARHYVVDANYVALVPDMAQRFRDLGVTHLFVNTAFFNSQGVTDTVSHQLVPFLDALGAWEKANQHRFTVLLWLNGSLNPANARYIDLSDPALRATLVRECERYLDPSVAGSHLAKTKRPSDGVMLDVEPAGANPELFQHINRFMQEIKRAAGDHQVGFAAHKIGNQNPYQFSDVFYHYLARNVDYIASMNYNSGKRTPEEYRDWMEQQTRDVLRAVSGVLWNNDAHHPAPTNGVKVFIGFASYPTDAVNHRPGVEIIPQAAAGTRAGLASLDELSRGYFQGAALYSHHDGVTETGYARWEHEWEEFRTHWLTP